LIIGKYTKNPGKVLRNSPKNLTIKTTEPDSPIVA
jgi:hypothetical protein